MTINLYNTMTGGKVPFEPRDNGKVSMYVCGPTTYNFIHLGNARPIVVFDTVRRYFMYKGNQVTYVQNFTDVDDKIINRSKEEGITAAAVAEKYIGAYFEDVQALNVLKADVHPKVTEHIPEIIELVQQLVDNGVAYEVNGDVYFSVKDFPEYGKLSGRDLDEMLAGARVMIGDQKRNPMDFALWKAAKPGEPSWDSPWGKGRPGWHIECSAMSHKYLGDGFDIHGGGADLIFPHHENEIAQSEAANRCEFVRYWMHNGFITVNNEKMSKSLGNFFLLRDILAKFPGDVVRFYLISTHYRSPIDFDDNKLDVATKSLNRIRNAYLLTKETLANAAPEGNPEADKDLTDAMAKAKADFEAAMDDDFNTADAISVIFEMVREINSATAADKNPTKAVAKAALDMFNELVDVLGLIYEDADDDAELAAEVEKLIEARQNARKEKNWAEADRIRDLLKDMGIVLMDTKQGVQWKKA